VVEAVADRLRVLLRTRLVCILLREGTAFVLRAVSAESPQLAGAARARHDRKGLHFAADLAIRAVAAGDAVLAPSTTRRLLDTYATGFTGPAAPPPAAPAVLEALTKRERNVFDEMAAGRTNKEIAARLFLSETTVKTHVVRILAKLDLRDRVQAVILAYEAGIVPPAGKPQGPPVRP